jgi:hypothetical protein
MRTDGRTDRQEEANSRSSEFFEIIYHSVCEFGIIIIINNNNNNNVNNNLGISYCYVYVFLLTSMLCSACSLPTTLTGFSVLFPHL